jgi:hypothetical protein
VEFGNRVSRLTPEAWDRLSARCAALNGPDFRAFLARTALAATPYKLPIPDPVRDRVSLRLIAGAGRVVATSIMFAYELAVEFEAPRPHDRSLSRRIPESRSSMPASTRLF